jgi:hypothetical protein
LARNECHLVKSEMSIGRQRAQIKILAYYWLFISPYPNQFVAAPPN